MENQIIPKNLQAISKAEIEVINKVEIDLQVATARQFPRNISSSLENIINLATLSRETAEKCFYALPRGNKRVVGATIRLAEIVAHCWGNLRAGARIINNDGRIITAQGFAHDLQNNLSVSVEARKRIIDKDGNPYTEDMQIVTANAVCAVAFRNTIFKLVPSVILNTVEEKIKEVIVGDADDFKTTVKKAFDYFLKKGVKEQDILDRIDCSSRDEVKKEDIFFLRGLATAIEDGEVKIGNAFMPTAKYQKQTKGLSKLSALGGNESAPAV